MSSSSHTGFRIVSLPREINNVSELAQFVEDSLKLGATGQLKIVNKTTPEGVAYKSAIVEMVKWSPGIDRFLKKKSSETNPSIILRPNQDFHLDFELHFENGAPMNHIKIAFMTEPIKVNPPPPAKVEQPAFDGSWNSIYIPMVFGKYTNEDGIKELFTKELWVGEVDRVDFVQRNEGYQTWLSAYVHFSKWFDDGTDYSIRRAIEAGQFRWEPKGSNQFLHFKINRSPIPKTDIPPANIHQVAAANEGMANKIAMLQDLIESMQSEIYSLHLELSMAGVERPFVHAGCKLLTEEESELWAKHGVFDVNENGEATVNLVLPITPHSELEGQIVRDDATGEEFAFEAM